MNSARTKAGRRSTDTVHGLTHAEFTTVTDVLFADPHTRRFAVEPDVRNTACTRSTKRSASESSSREAVAHPTPSEGCGQQAADTEGPRRVHPRTAPPAPRCRRPTGGPAAGSPSAATTGARRTS